MSPEFSVVTPRLVLIVPGWIGSPGEDSLVRGRKALEQLAEQGEVFKLSAIAPELETPEAAYLGLDPHTLRMRQGPLTVAALGVDPPSRSVHFHLSLMSFVGDRARTIGFQVPEGELRAVMEAAARLNTSRLTVVVGEGVDHGLVWEDGSVELGTTAPSAMGEEPMRRYLPEGDGETMLRRFIDDSVNLLSELPLNYERMEEGLPPLNLLWLWGQGFREPVPNLALQRGEPALVESGSLRLQGLTRLARYRHGDRRAFGSGVNVRLARLRELAEREPVVIAVIESVRELRERGMLEEADWLSAQVDSELLTPLLEGSSEFVRRVTVLSPAVGSVGLGVSFDSRGRMSNSMPFDERAIEERLVPVRSLWEAVAESLKP